MASKKKLIYAEDLFATLRDDININGAHLARVKRHIENAPAVDAVEVVRCKDCLHNKYNPFGDGCRVCIKLSRRVEEDFFCAYGERREGE